MNCILLWHIMTLFLYKCPKSYTVSEQVNCTEVHRGIYDYDVMLMCKERLDIPATPFATESSTTTLLVTSSVAPTSTSPSHVLTHGATTSQIYSTTTMSPTPTTSTTSSYIRGSTSTTSHIQSTTQDPTPNRITFPPTTTPTYIQKNKTEENLSASNHISYHTVIEKNTSDANPIMVVALCLSILSIILCIVFGIWSCKKHKDYKMQSVVLPKEENQETKTKKVRKPMKRSPSQVKKMTLQDWKQLNSSLQSNPSMLNKKKVPPVNRRLKGKRHEFQPPAPHTKSVSMKVPDENKTSVTVEKNVRNVKKKESTVKSMIKKFNAT